MIRRVFFILCLISAFSCVLAQEIQFGWAKNVGGSGDERGNSITVDSGGDILTTGSFKGTADFDPTDGVYELTSKGDEDIFVQKLNSIGQLVWAVSIGGINIDRGKGIAIDSEGNVYVVGSFTETVDFDPGNGVYEISVDNSWYSYILKLDSSGNFVWVKKLDSGGANSVEIDEYGNIYTVGYTINKINIDGSIEWSIDPAGIIEGFSLKAKSGYLYITGRFEGTIDFDNGTDEYTLTSTNSNSAALWAESDIFVLKLDYSGNFKWVKQLGGDDRDTGCGITVDNYDNVYITGVFYATGDFDPGSGTFELENRGDTDIFITRLDQNGNFGWSKGIGSTSFDNAESITVDNGSNLYITGDFNEVVDFDPGIASFFLEGNSNGNHNQFLLALNGNGEFIWATRGASGDQSYSVGNSICIDNNNNLYTIGTFYETSEFDFDYATTSLTSAGEGDIFISKSLVSNMPNVVPTEIVTSLSSNVFKDQPNSSFFPNPASDIIFTNNELINELHIYNANGRLISKGKIVQGKYDVSNLPSGIYLLNSLNIKGESTFERIILN